MAKIKFETGQIVEFNGTPTSQDVEEVSRSLGIQKPISSNKKAVVSERDERISQGLPVGKKADGSPTLAGSIVREIAKMPVKAALSVARPIIDPLNKKGGLSVNTKYLGNVGDYGTEIEKRTDVLADKYKAGDISLGRALVGGAGAGALQAMDFASVLPIGGATGALAKGALPTIAEQGVLRTAGKAVIPTTKQALKEAAIRGGAVSGGYDLSEQLASGEKINPLQTAGATAFGTAADFGFTKAFPEIVKKATGVKLALSPKGKEDRIINKIENEIFNIQNNYVKTRRKADFAKDGLLSNRQRVAASGVLDGAVDENGLIRTKQPGGAVEKYRAGAIDGREGIVRQILEKENNSISPEDLRKVLIQSIENDPFIKGADKISALNKINSEIEGYIKNADGNIPLTEVHDAKIASGKNVKDFATPGETKSYLKALNKGLKEAVENGSQEDIKAINKELSKFYADIDLLDSLDGARVKGGKLGRYTAQIGGNLVGAIAGNAVGGPVGGPVGAVIGGEIANTMKGNAFKKTFPGLKNPFFQKSEILENAATNARKPKLPPLLGAGKGFENNAGIQLPAPKKPVSFEPRAKVVNTEPAKKQLALPKPKEKVIELPKNVTKSTLGSDSTEKAFIRNTNDRRKVIQNPNKKAVDLPKTNKAIQAAKDYIEKKGGQNSAYAMVGIEVDEDGNISFNPEKAAIGFAAGGFAQTKAGKELFQGFSDLSLKTLERMAGKAKVSKQFILDQLKREDVVKPERELMESILKDLPDDVNVKDFANRVKTELLPLKRKSSIPSNIDTDSVDTYLQAKNKYPGQFAVKFQSTALPDELRGNVKNYSEHLYDSPIKTKAGDTHFGNMTDNYFAHSRIEDMADGKTRRVIELQSDLMQKGNLEREGPKIDNLTRQEFEKGMTPDEVARYREAYRVNKEEYTVPLSTADANPNYKAKIMSSRKTIDELENKAYPIVTKARQAEVAKLQPYENDWFKRIIPEEVKSAAVDGKERVLFPTGETAMKIEGLGDTGMWHNWSAQRLSHPTMEGVRGPAPLLSADNMKVGNVVVERNHNITGQQSEWIITDVLGDGKFKAVQKDTIMNMEEYLSPLGYNSPDTINFNDPKIKELFNSEFRLETEQFDISGKVDTNNPIYRFYDGDVRKYLKRFNATEITDDKGVKWLEVKVTPEMKEMPVGAFGYIEPGTRPKIEIPKAKKKVTLPKATSPLEEEAKKYKSAEEFVKAKQSLEFKQTKRKFDKRLDEAYESMDSEEMLTDAGSMSYRDFVKKYEAYNLDGGGLSNGEKAAHTIAPKWDIFPTEHESWSKFMDNESGMSDKYSKAKGIKLAQGYYDKSFSPPLVEEINGKYYVLDGHHRVANLLAEGQDSIPVYLDKKSLKNIWEKMSGKKIEYTKEKQTYEELFPRVESKQELEKIWNKAKKK